MLATALARVWRCRAAAGDRRVAGLRAQDGAGGCRYELGMGVDLEPLPAAELNGSPKSTPPAARRPTRSSRRCSAAMVPRRRGGRPRRPLAARAVRAADRPSRGRAHALRLPPAGLRAGDQRARPGTLAGVDTRSCRARSPPGAHPPLLTTSARAVPARSTPLTARGDHPAGEHGAGGDLVAIVPGTTSAGGRVRRPPLLRALLRQRRVPRERRGRRDLAAPPGNGWRWSWAQIVPGKFAAVR